MSNDNTGIAAGYPEDVGSEMLRRSDRLAIAEGVILLGGLALLNYSGIVPFSVFPVHPYLFVVILLSAQYGLYGGILTALGAAVLVHGGGLPVRTIDMTYAQYFRLAWADTLSWVVAALMLGLVTTRRSRVFKEQTQRLREAALAEALIAGQYQVLAQRTHLLERSLAARKEANAADSTKLNTAPSLKRLPRAAQTSG